MVSERCPGAAQSEITTAKNNRKLDPTWEEEIDAFFSRLEELTYQKMEENGGEWDQYLSLSTAKAMLEEEEWRHLVGCGYRGNFEDAEEEEIIVDGESEKATAAMTYDNNVEDAAEEEIVVDGESDKAIATPPAAMACNEEKIQSMSTQIDGFPCVLLLNLSGESGCSNPGPGKVVAPVVNAMGLDGSAEVWVSVDEIESLLLRVSKDSDFAMRVAGVLVESRAQDQNSLNGYSPDVKFPQAEFAPYQNNNFEWNPGGSGNMWKSYNLPAFLLSQTSTLALQEMASNNEKRTKSYTEGVVEFDLVMQGSVWSALPPINISSSLKAKPIILVLTPMDSASFFRDKSLGAESPISGLIALLAVVVCNELDKTAAEIRKARRMKLPIVREDYSVAYIKRQKKLPFNLYKVESTGNTHGVATVIGEGRDGSHFGEEEGPSALYVTFLPILKGDVRAVLQGDTNSELGRCLGSEGPAVQDFKGSYLVFVAAGFDPFDVITNERGLVRMVFDPGGKSYGYVELVQPSHFETVIDGVDSSDCRLPLDMGRLCYHLDSISWA